MTNQTSAFNDFNMDSWKEIPINTDSLWIIGSRDKSGKHENNYHGNFIPQIANELILRYTKKDEVVLDTFLGSGTSMYECEKLERKCIGLDINESILSVVGNKMGLCEPNRFYYGLCDNTNTSGVGDFMDSALKYINAKSVQFVIMHPPYADIVKFTDKPYDLSQFSDADKFINAFKKTCENALKFLDKNRYFAVVIGDAYKNSEIVPLGFLCMNMIKQNFKVKLKGVIVKNIEGNRGKLGVGGIWRYRALKSDYYIFKHEYIFVFKKEF